jgi:hypothetical protein
MCWQTDRGVRSRDQVRIMHMMIGDNVGMIVLDQASKSIRSESHDTQPIRRRCGYLENREDSHLRGIGLVGVPRAKRV